MSEQRSCKNKDVFSLPYKSPSDFSLLVLETSVELHGF